MAFTPVQKQTNIDLMKQSMAGGASGAAANATLAGNKALNTPGALPKAPTTQPQLPLGSPNGTGGTVGGGLGLAIKGMTNPLLDTLGAVHDAVNPPAPKADNPNDYYIAPTGEKVYYDPSKAPGYVDPAIAAANNPVAQTEKEFQDMKTQQQKDYDAGISQTNELAQYQTYDQYRAAQSKHSADLVAQAQGNANTQQSLDAAALAKSTAQARSAEQGYAAQNAQGREGVVGSSKPDAIKGMFARTEADIAYNQKQMDLAQTERQQAIAGLQYAQAKGDTAAAEAYQGKLAGAQDKIDRIQNQNKELASAEAAAIEKKRLDDATIASSAAGTLKTQMETATATFASFGDTMGKMSSADLTSQATQMATQMNLPFSTVANLQAQAIITNKLKSAKDAGEAQKLQLDLQKLQAEIPNAGVPKEVQLANAYGKLTPAQQADYNKVNGTGDWTLGTVKTTDADGNVTENTVRFNKNTNEIINMGPAATGNKDNNGIPSGAPVTFTIGDKTVKAQPVFASAFQHANADFLAATGKNIQVNSSLRSNDEQKAIRTKFGYTDDTQPSGAGGLPMAAPPGTSFHERGLAVDVENWKEAAPYLAKYGIVNGLKADMNHFSMGEMNPSVFGATKSGPAGTTGDSGIDTTVDGYTTKAVAGGRTQAAVDQAALVYATTGMMPALGNASKGATGQFKTAIENRAAEMDAGGNISSHKTELAAHSASLIEQTKTYNDVKRALTSAEQSGQQTLDKFASKGINTSDSTYLNTKLNDLAKNFKNADDLRAYQAGLYEVGNDYAQVFARGGSRNIQGNEDAQNIINGNITLGALKGVLDELKGKGQIVVDSAKGQMSSIQDDINNILGVNIKKAQSNGTGTSGSSTWTPSGPLGQYHQSNKAANPTPEQVQSSNNW